MPVNSEAQHERAIKPPGTEALGYSYEACQADLAAYGGFVGIAQTPVLPALVPQAQVSLPKGLRPGGNIGYEFTTIFVEVILQPKRVGYDTDPPYSTTAGAPRLDPIAPIT